MTRPIILTAMCLLLVASFANAQGVGPGDGNGVCQFIDEDGDGFNDLAPDADGDGIPNGMDPDYVKPEDGTGSQLRNQNGKLGEIGGAAMGFGHAYTKMNAYKGEGPGNGEGLSHSYGPGDGTGNGVGPADGTGFGPGDGTGECDGSGAGGVNANRSGRR